MSSKSRSDDGEQESRSEADSPVKAGGNVAQSARPAAKRRTKTGCLTCRKRRIKCDEEKPFCKNCSKSKRECAGYVQPLVYKQQQGYSGIGAGVCEPHVHDFGYPPRDSAIPYFHPQPETGPYMPYTGHDQNAYVDEATYRTPLSAVPSYHYPDPSNFIIHSAPQSGLDDAGSGGFNSHHMQHFEDAVHRTPSSAAGQGNVWPVRGGWTPDVQHSYEPDPVSYEATAVPSGMVDVPAYGYLPHTYEQLPRHHLSQSLHQSKFPRPRVSRLVTPTEELDGSGNGHPGNLSSANGEYKAYPDDREVGWHHGQAGGHASDRIQAQPVRSQRAGMLRSMRPTQPLSPVFDERNEKVFRHFVDVLGICMSTFERHPTNPLAPPQQHLWSYTMASAAFANPALAHAILAVSSLHISKIQHTSDSIALKHFTYAARRVGKLLSVAGKRHEATTLATVLLLGYYEILNADHSRWNLHLAGATKLLSEQDITRMSRRVRAARRRALQISTNGVASSSLPTDDAFRAGIAPSLFDEIEWDVDVSLIQELTGEAIQYDEVEPGILATPDYRAVSEAEIGTHRTKMDLWWWFCKQDLFQSMVSGDRLLMPYEHNISCPPRGKINVPDRPYATFDHLVLIMSRLSDFGGRDRHRKQRSVTAQGGQWMPPPWLSVPPQGPPQSSQNTPFSPNATHPFQPTKPTSAGSSTQGLKPAVRDRNPSANEGRAIQRGHSEGVQSAGEGAGFGMMPQASGSPKMHSAFRSLEESINSGASYQAEPRLTEAARELSLEEETKLAYAEHKQIVKVFAVFRRSLGPGFQALPDDGRDFSSPFGRALRYAGPEIACVWAHYYVGLTLIQRLHPDMPPAAMIAAGITAGLTKGYAQAVGQICAGLFASLPAAAPGQPLSPRFAAAFMEISFALLFCGVQYIDALQRGWIVAKLHNIAQMTGWQTSAAVAAACEIAWERMAQAGRGPPYTRTTYDPSLQSDIRIAPLVAQHVASVSEVESEHDSQILNHDRSLISKHGSSRVHWAMGIMSVEEDMRQMNIGAG